MSDSNFFKAKWKISTLILTAALLTVSFISLYQFKTAPYVSASPSFIEVSISGPKKLNVNETGQYQAILANPAKNSYSFTWSLSPQDNKTLFIFNGDVCSLTFLSATEEPYLLSVSVKDLVVGNLGSASLTVYDPYTSPNMYLNSFAMPYNYLIEADGVGWYRAVNGQTGTISWTSTNATTIWNSAVIANIGTVHFSNGAFAFGANKIYVSSNVSVIGAGKGVTIFTFTTGGVIMGTSDYDTTLRATLEGVTIQGNNAGQVGLSRINNWYGDIKNVEVTGFLTGMMENSTETGINIVNTAENLFINNCTKGLIVDRFNITSGPGGNNLNSYYGLWIVGNSKTESGSIGIWGMGGEGNQVLGGWVENFETGIRGDSMTSWSISGIWMEGLSTFVNFASTAQSNTVTSLAAYNGGSDTYLIDNVTTAGVANTVIFSKTLNYVYQGKSIELQASAHIAWEIGTSLGSGGADSELWIGHDASDNLVFNMPTGKTFIIRVNGSEVFSLSSSGEINHLRVRNSNTYIAVEATDTSKAISLVIAEPDEYYVPLVAFSFDAGWWWTTDQTVNGFTLHWNTTAGGAGAPHFGYAIIS